jgi:DNA helicase-2/ATP-dependent DNA helicase PcrA
MIQYEQELNPDQRRVVFAEGGPMLIIAGAGSGKTRTLTYRVARLIEKGLGPDRILLATFTNKAAREMLTRVERLIGVDTTRLWGGTFHHLANRTLRRHAPLLGYGIHYAIADDEDASQLINTCIAALGIDTKGERFPKGRVLNDVISYSVNTEMDIEKVIADRVPHFSHWSAEILEVASLYRRKKREANLMDFDDLLLNWRELLRSHPDVRADYGRRFEHILVDEYQDTNRIQAEIMDLLASVHRNLMVVGDDSQSIYSFRGANFENILQFPEKYRDARIYKLEANYRSTPEILHLANRSIRHNEIQFHKELRPVRRRGVRPKLVSTLNAVYQAGFVAQRIVDLLSDGMPMHEIAVLYRAHYHSMELQMEMTRRGIPFEIRSGIRFFEQAHVKDVTAYLRVLVNPLDEPAWKRILGLCDRIGKKTAEKIWRFISTNRGSLEAVFSEDFLKSAPKNARPGLLGCQSIVKDLAGSTGGMPPAELIAVILEKGYRAVLRERYPDSRSREEDLAQLGDFSAKFRSLEEFLSELALMTNMVEEDDSYYLDRRDGKIVLSTIHQAKGMEWSVVFLISCCDGMMPLARALKDQGGEEEERRLFYVASTRAKDQLYLCYTLLGPNRGMNGGDGGPSRFIRELASAARSPRDYPFDHLTAYGD